MAHGTSGTTSGMHGIVRCPGNLKVLMCNLQYSFDPTESFLIAHDYINTCTEITTLHINGIVNTSIYKIQDFLDPLLTNLINNTRITKLTISPRIEHASRVLSKYISENRSLNKLRVHYNCITTDDVNQFLRAISTKTNWISLSAKITCIVDTHPPPPDQVCDFSVLCTLAERNADLEYLSIFYKPEIYGDLKHFPGTSQGSESFNLLIECVATHTKLTHFEMNCYADAEKVLNGIKHNTKLLNLELHYPLASQKSYNDKVGRFISRNKLLLWKNVHPVLLNFTLIFYKLPAYIILEIFDWVPDMYLVKHYIKIRLIINTLKSIHKIKS